MERLKNPRRSRRAEEPPAAPRVEPGPRQRRAFSTWGGPVEAVGEPAAAGLLRRLFDVDQGLSRALTHGFHSYAGRLPPSLARQGLEALSQPGDLVVDPFCGSGTVLVEAYLGGRRAFGSDVSPLAVLIAETRTDCLDEAGRAELMERATRIAEESAEVARKRQRPDVPPWASNEFGRFQPHIVLELLGLRALVFAEAEAAAPAIGRALRLVFSSILVKFMKAGSEAPRDGASKRVGRGLPSRLYVDRARELAQGLAALSAGAPAGTPAPTVKLGDARELRGVRNESAKLVLTSPPYAGTYDYAAQHDVRFAWLDLPRRGFNQRQIGGRAGGIGADPEAWSEARRAWLSEMRRVLVPGGHALLVVGDGVVGARPEHGAEAVEQVAEMVGLEPVARASQDRPIMDRRISALFGQRVRQEHAVLLRKPTTSSRRDNEEAAPSGARSRKPPRRG